MRPTLPKIWIITNPAHRDGPVAPLAKALEDCPPGIVGVQLRAPEATDRELVAWGRSLRAITRDVGATLTVNRRLDIAEIVGADGVHLPERALSPGQARAHASGLRLVGVSRHDRPGLVEAAEQGASFAFLSPVFDVPDKALPMGIGGFRGAIAGVDLPTYALGGIDATTVPALLRAGARGIAVRRAIYDAPDPKATLDALLGALDNDPANGE